MTTDHIYLVQDVMAGFQNHYKRLNKCFNSVTLTTYLPDQNHIFLTSIAPKALIVMNAITSFTS